MKRNTLGRTGLQVSELGFGCSSFWAKSAFPERRAVELVRTAIDLGINLFDTGSSYARGQAERRLGAALRGYPRRDELVVATKAGTRVSASGSTYRDFSAAGVRASVEQSLRNLELDAIPLLHLHVPRRHDVTDELMACVSRLRDEGLVRCIGVHGRAPGIRELVLETPLLETAMFDFNVLHAERRFEIAELARVGKGVLGATPLAQMLFSDRIFAIRRLADAWYLLRALKNRRGELRRGRRFRFLDRVEGWTGAEVALAYALANPDVAVSIFGTTSMERLRANVAVSGRKLPPELVARIEST